MSGMPCSRTIPSGGHVPLLNRIKSFLSSPQGRRLTDQGRRHAADPRNRERARSLFARLRGRP